MRKQRIYNNGELAKLKLICSHCGKYICEHEVLKFDIDDIVKVDIPIWFCSKCKRKYTLIQKDITENIKKGKI